MKSIVVPAALESLGSVTDFVASELEHLDCPAKALNQIEIAVEEILVNIASYAGLAHDDGVEVRCEVLGDPARVVLQFLDEGIPFDPLAADDPDISPAGIESRVGGLGIFMVKKMMDGVSYAYEDGKNTLTITKGLA